MSAAAARKGNFQGEADFAKTKRAPEASAGSYRSEHRTISSVMRAARALWPRKTSSELAIRAGVTQRQAEHWLAGTYDLSADALTCLLRSDEGLSILEELVGDVKPVWWRDFKRQVSRAELRRRQDEIRRELDELDAAESTS